MTLADHHTQRELSAACDRLSLPEPSGEDGHTPPELPGILPGSGRAGSRYAALASSRPELPSSKPAALADFLRGHTDGSALMRRLHPEPKDLTGLVPR